MKKIARRYSFLLLLALVVSQVSLAVHVIEHIGTEEQSCQLCSLRDDTASAIPPTGLIIAAALSVEENFVTPAISLARPSPSFFQARAPPLIV